jgi:hypothetical protein
VPEHKTKVEPTMTAYISALTAEDMSICTFAVNQHNDANQIQIGALPFIPLRVVVDCLLRMGKRRHLAIAEKLKVIQHDDTDVYNKTRMSVSVIMMTLNDRKVMKRFGIHPEDGVKIPLVEKVKVTVGVKYSLPVKDYIPDDDVLVSPIMTLRRQSTPFDKAGAKFGHLGRWQVTCATRYKQHVMDFLTTNCGA